MGGNALKIKTNRLNLSDFINISSDISNILTENKVKHDIIKSHKNKDSFGDIDILINQNTLLINIIKFIKLNFNPIEIHHNGDCYSFDYKNVQIDFITSHDDNYISKLIYYNYGLGSFIGRIAQKFGLKYGQEGLFYKHKFKGSYIGIIYISTDYPKIYNFFNLDYSKWEKGFDELEDIFKFVYESEYFDGSIFQMDQLNKVNRDRNAKRASYTSLLDWIDAQPEKRYEFADKEYYITKIDEVFPEANLIENIRRLEYEHCKKLYIQSKFNGKHIMEKYDLQGKELGDAIVGFKKFIMDSKDMSNLGGIYFGESFDEYILRKTKDEIFAFFELYLLLNMNGK